MKFKGKNVKNFLVLWVIYIATLTSLSLVAMLILAPAVTFMKTGNITFWFGVEPIEKICSGIILGSLSLTTIMYFFGGVFKE